MEKHRDQIFELTVFGKGVSCKLRERSIDKLLLWRRKYKRAFTDDADLRASDSILVHFVVVYQGFEFEQEVAVEIIVFRSLGVLAREFHDGIV
jgi:hypothetical protein